MVVPLGLTLGVTDRRVFSLSCRPFMRDHHLDGLARQVTGRPLDTASFPRTTAGYTGLLAWMTGHGTLDRVGVESTGSWGAGLTRHLTDAGVTVVEVDRPDPKARHLDGKTDTIDAVAAARAVISGAINRHPQDPRRQRRSDTPTAGHQVQHGR